LPQSISGEVLSINAGIGANVNRSGMKATKCISLSANPRAVGLQAASATLTVLHRRQRLFVLVVSLSAVLASGCQTFNMSPEKFAEQQRGHYDCTPEAKTVEVAGCLLYFLSACSGRRMPDPAPEP